MNYLNFALKEKRILSFGLSLTFFSSFGQTFLISLFVPYFLQEFDLSNASFGTMYSAATLASAGLMPYLGRWIDRIHLRKYSLMVACSLLLASLIVSLSWHIAVLFVGIMLLRISGQGLSSHTAQTAMARYYTIQRGKALSISSLGYPIGEGILPLIIAGILGVVSWRTTWGIIVLFIGLVLIPLIFFLLNEKEYELGHEDSVDNDNGGGSIYSTLFSDLRFWLLIPAVLIPPFWATGLFLYQVSIAEQLGWTATLIASAFVGFAGSRILSSLLIGPLIDRFSARGIFPFYLIPFGIGVIFAYYHPGNWSAFAYMIFIGITMGMGSNVKSALWAELYGRDVIGTVRSLFSSMMVFSTALIPFLMGWALDYGIAMTTILLIALASIVIASVLAGAAFILHR